VKGDKRAAAARLLAVTNRYPLYSKSDQALWMMGDILEKSEHKEVAALYYGRIVKNYPLSGMAPGAKDKLKSFGAPVPQPDPNAVAWMTAEQNTPRPHTSLVKKPLALVSNGPKGELKVAARNGAPNLQPESESVSPVDILKPGGTSSGRTGLIAVVTPGASGTSDPAATSENVAPPESEGTSEPPKDAGTAPATASPAASDDPAKNPPAAESATETPAKAEATTPGAEAKSDGAVAGAESKSGATDAAKTDDSQNSGDAKKESSSKKKKGLRKLVPW
jgi:outer membrane protein assembly factor BamD